MTIKLYTVPEAAEFLRMPVNTFRKHIPEIKRSKIGRHLLFKEESLIEYLDKRSSKPLSELKSAS